ncbi:MAG: hypothetical protein ABMA01_04300 [Chthoniobacteraceae bacterium]
MRNTTLPGIVTSRSLTSIGGRPSAVFILNDDRRSLAATVPRHRERTPPVENKAKKKGRTGANALSPT